MIMNWKDIGSAVLKHTQTQLLKENVQKQGHFNGLKAYDWIAVCSWGFVVLLGFIPKGVGSFGILGNTHRSQIYPLSAKLQPADS